MFRKRVKYIIDPISLSLKTVEKSGKYLTKKILSGLGISVLVGVVLALTFFHFIDSPQESRINREINNYRLRLEVLNSKADKLYFILNTLQSKDDRTYRTIFAMNPLSEDERNPGIGGADDLYSNFDIVEGGAFLKDILSKLDLINRRIIIQSDSYNKLSLIIRDKEKMLAAIPSIMPVDRNRIKFSSGFGWRRNPFSHSGSQFHPGIDMAGKVGTPIYATGDGVVIDPFSAMTGYGIVIVIDHGYGFQTLYAHLSKKLVKPGDVVKRGQVIGLLGNTAQALAHTYIMK